MARLENKQIVMSIAIVVLSAAFVLLQYLPVSRKTRMLKADNVILATENSSASKRLGMLPEINASVKKFSEHIGNFDAKIPVGRSHGEFLQELSQVMQSQGLKDLVIQPGEESKFGEIYKIPVCIRCQGKLVDIFKFFKAMENFERVIQVEEVSMTGNDKFDGTLAMQAEANIFFRTK